MDFQRFGIDPRLAEAAEDLETSFFFYEKMFSLAVEKEENVCAKITLDAGREEVILLPALQWLLGSDDRRLLVAASDEPGADRLARAVERLGAKAGLGLRRARSRDGGEVSLEGESDARVLLGQPEELLGSGLDLRGYGFLVLDGVDKLAERSVDSIRKFASALLPAWERRSILACDKLSLKAKNLAWDLADNPAELSVAGEAAKAESVRKETWSVPGDSKMKFLLGLLGREPSPRVCVFCNLRDSAEELAKRLAANGIASDYILGALALDRKRAVLGKVRSGACRCLVLTDPGAEGLDPGAFPLVVNFDIPLEPELFVKRLEMLDREDESAKLVSIACERYVYGLAAVESYIDVKLDAAPIDDSMLASEDKSEGMNLGKRRQQGQGQGRDSRGGDSRRSESRRQDPRQQHRGGRGRERERGGDRSPDIRKSISEATGGTLDMSSSAGIGGKAPRGQNQQQPASPRQPAQPQRQQQKAKQKGQAPQQHKGGQQRRPTEQAKRGTGRGQENRQGNPYELPIEERMKLYREKYGQSLGDDAKQGGAAKQGERRAEDARRRPAARPETPAAQASESRDKNREEQRAGAQSPGVIGRIFGAFKKKGDKA